MNPKNFILSFLSFWFFLFFLFPSASFVLAQEEEPLSFDDVLAKVQEKISQIIAEVIDIKNSLAQITATSYYKLKYDIYGPGKLTFDPPGTSCGRSCRKYNRFTVVNITATPASGYYLEKWGGACSGVSGDTCQVTMYRDLTVKAYFKRVVPRYELIVSVFGRGKVTGPGIDCGNDCTETYDEGRSVYLEAVPDYGEQFLGWSGDCYGTSRRCKVSMYSNKNVSASFSGESPPPPPPPGGSRPPVILNFKASPSSVSTGQCTLLSWKVLDARNCSGSITGLGTLPGMGAIQPKKEIWEGGVFVCPSVDYNSTLTCSNEIGSVSESISVDVDDVAELVVNIPPKPFECKEALASMDTPTGNVVFSVSPHLWKPEKMDVRVQDLYGGIVFEKSRISGNIFVWDGKGNKGRYKNKQVANGVYFLSTTITAKGKTVGCPLTKFYYLK